MEMFSHFVDLFVYTYENMNKSWKQLKNFIMCLLPLDQTNIL